MPPGLLGEHQQVQVQPQHLDGQQKRQEPDGQVGGLGRPERDGDKAQEPGQVGPTHDAMEPAQPLGIAQPGERLQVPPIGYHRWYRRPP
ncbi:MAG TPA: hypothetical protein VGO93_26290 [Candidatus Xenobia bacterium]